MRRHRPAPSFLPDPWPPSPSPSPSYAATLFPNSPSEEKQQPAPPSKLPVEFSPPLIAMVVIVATAFVIITFSRLLSRHFIHAYDLYKGWRRRRYVPSVPASDAESPPYPFDPTEAFHALSPYGLDETIIKTIPLSVYAPRKSGFHECAVCLLEFEADDYVRTLPVCAHTFHVDCIDIWLRSHANCPLCRAGIFRQDSLFTPLMAARIRPSLDDILIETTILEPLDEFPVESEEEITQEPSPRRSNSISSNQIQSEERLNRRDFLLKRSYSFGFERNLGSERLVLEPVTASPWRYRRTVGGSLWSKRHSPFGSLSKPRVFSSRYYRGMKSPFFRRRSIGGLFPLSESSARPGLSSGGSSSRRTKSFASPMFMRSSGGAAFSSSRLRSGDPEALLSPDRFSRR